jgi:assimilatory nitrate reductase catalytic subunit
VVVAINGQGDVKVSGDRDHPANLGRLCSKGAALAETLGLDDRLLYPEVDGARVDWDEALDTVSVRLRKVIDEHGPDAVAFYVSGQLLTEDYYVANKLMKGFIGSANIDTNSRLCMSSAVAAHKRAFGADTVPCDYEDLERADLVVLVGSNLAWCHPVLYQRILAQKKRSSALKVVVIDPRRTASCDGAELHLALRAGTDAVLFNGLLAWLSHNGYVDQSFVEQHTDGSGEAVRLASWYSPSMHSVAEQCGLAVDDVARFYHLFASTERVVTLFSQGVNQSTSGTDKGNAIINCHLLTGRIGQSGSGPFSITGQPNAMGGREVGGLSNQLAAHMELSVSRHRELVERFWQTRNLARTPGLKAVDLFRAVEAGKIKAIWIIATNPAVSLPANDKVRHALSQCQCVVVSDCVDSNDTLGFADIRLPALAWGEKDGTVTNSERRISRQRAFLPPPGAARPDWWILCEVARRLGHAGFGYAGVAEIFDEHARLSAFENGGERDFDLSGLVGLGNKGYDELGPVQWPCRPSSAPRARLFADGRFFTASRRAHFVPVTPRPPAHFRDANYPWILNTGRVRDHWHTMTRTGKSPRLSGHTPEPFLAMHPDDAQRLSLEEGQLARVSSFCGGAILRVRLSDQQPRGELFAPMHWNDQYAAAARVGSMIGPATDPISGQPEFKHMPVRVEPFAARWYGFVISRRQPDVSRISYWAKVRRPDVWLYELAGDALPDDWALYARELLDEGSSEDEWRELHDSTGVNYRAARIRGGRLDAVIIVMPQHRLPPRDWLVALFAKDGLVDAERGRLLRGTPPAGEQDAGAIICSCFSVGVNTLVAAIRAQDLVTPEAVGAALGAGTNCGSCIPEIRRLIARERPAAVVG